jgi:hypothetical protein
MTVPPRAGSADGAPSRLGQSVEQFPSQQQVSAAEGVSRATKGGRHEKVIEAPHEDFTQGAASEVRPDGAAPGGWQPIETAPKDGTNVLLCHPWNNLCYVGYFGEGPSADERSYCARTEKRWRVRWDESNVEGGLDKPGFWMPILPMPAEPAE